MTQGHRSNIFEAAPGRHAPGRAFAGADHEPAQRSDDCERRAHARAVTLPQHRGQLAWVREILDEQPVRARVVLSEELRRRKLHEDDEEQAHRKPGRREAHPPLGAPHDKEQRQREHGWRCKQPESHQIAPETLQQHGPGCADDADARPLPDHQRGARQEQRGESREEVGEERRIRPEGPRDARAEDARTRPKTGKISHKLYARRVLSGSAHLRRLRPASAAWTPYRSRCAREPSDILSGAKQTPLEPPRIQHLPDGAGRASLTVQRRHGSIDTASCCVRRHARASTER